MQLKTILNHVQKFKSFVYGTVRWVEHAGGPALEVEVVERAKPRETPLIPLLAKVMRKRRGNTPIAPVYRKYECFSQDRLLRPGY